MTFIHISISGFVHDGNVWQFVIDIFLLFSFKLQKKQRRRQYSRFNFCYCCILCTSEFISIIIWIERLVSTGLLVVVVVVAHNFYFVFYCCIFQLCCCFAGKLRLYVQREMWIWNIFTAMHKCNNFSSVYSIENMYIRKSKLRMATNRECDSFNHIKTASTQNMG